MPWEVALFLFSLMNSLLCVSNCAQLLLPGAGGFRVSRQGCTLISSAGLETKVIHKGGGTLLCCQCGGVCISAPVLLAAFALIQFEN